MPELRDAPTAPRTRRRRTGCVVRHGSVRLGRAASLPGPDRWGAAAARAQLLRRELGRRLPDRGGRLLRRLLTAPDGAASSGAGRRGGALIRVTAAARSGRGDREPTGLGAGSRELLGDAADRGAERAGGKERLGRAG